jgi:hypothetical protein
MTNNVDVVTIECAKEFNKFAPHQPSGYPDTVISISSKALPADPLKALKEIVRCENQLDRLRLDRVKVARSQGASWEEIASALGMSRQSAWEYYTSRFRIEFSHRVKKNPNLSDDAAMQLAVSETKAVRRAK